MSVFALRGGWLGWRGKPLPGPHLSPIMRVLAGWMPGNRRCTISNMNLLGLPSTTGCLPAAVLTAATMAPVPVEEVGEEQGGLVVRG